jgi:hypothetical protein
MYGTRELHAKRSKSGSKKGHMLSLMYGSLTYNLNAYIEIYNHIYIYVYIHIHIHSERKNKIV